MPFIRPANIRDCVTRSRMATRTPQGPKSRRMLDAEIPIKKITDDGFRTSLFTPFTGSTKNDIEFYNSLRPKQQKMFKAAMKRRGDILQRYHQFIFQP